jgi:hypothetical protein
VSRAKNWRYHAAKRRNFAKMYGPDESKNWANTPTGRVKMDTTRRPSPAWNGLRHTATFQDEFQRLINDHPPLASADFSAIEQRILATMSMSRDRVRFVLQPYGGDSATAAAFLQAFKAPFPSAPMGQEVTIVCRPSQFARFLIYRNEAGGRNLFKELKPELFTPQPKISEIDVSGNPAG